MDEIYSNPDWTDDISFLSSGFASIASIGAAETVEQLYKSKKVFDATAYSKALQEYLHATKAMVWKSLISAMIKCKQNICIYYQHEILLIIVLLNLKKQVLFLNGQTKMLSVLPKQIKHGYRKHILKKWA